MASYVTVTLDTTGPAGVAISLASGANYAGAQLINADIACSDSDKTSYQMKVWGDIDTSYDVNVQATEVASAWITYAASKQIKLSSGDGNKVVYCKVRDDVYNESAQASDNIVLDMTIPVVTIGGPDVPKVSLQTGKNTAVISFQSNADFVEYKVCVVGSPSATQDTGSTIPTTAGSTNTSATGSWTTASVVTTTIKGTDLRTASTADGPKYIKVFVREASGNWSV